MTLNVVLRVEACVCSTHATQKWRMKASYDLHVKAHAQLAQTEATRQHRPVMPIWAARRMFWSLKGVSTLAMRGAGPSQLL